MTFSERTDRRSVDPPPRSHADLPPFRDFVQTAAVLDARRLGKQRVEVLQILRALTFDDYGWRTHPAVTMWGGFTEALGAYGVPVTQQWIAAGFGDTVLPQLLEFSGAEPPRTQAELAPMKRACTSTEGRPGGGGDDAPVWA